MSIQKIRRADGRSNSQVLLDLVAGHAPGTLFRYDELSTLLSAGMGKRYARPEVQRIVTKTCPRMLKEQARTLHNVINQGYRIAEAAHHMTLAQDRKSRADKQMLRGVQVLEHVRWDELDANQKMAHQGQLLIVNALYQNMKLLERRQTAVEQAIQQIQSGMQRP